MDKGNAAPQLSSAEMHLVVIEALDDRQRLHPDAVCLDLAATGLEAFFDHDAHTDRFGTGLTHDVDRIARFVEADHRPRPHVPVVETAWLTMPDLVEVLGEPLGRVRRLLDDRHLIGSKRTGVFAVPEVFVVDGAPLGSLRGTIIVLQDAGFSDDEVIDWLLADEESIGAAPIEALRRGRKAEVRRVAQTLA